MRATRLTALLTALLLSAGLVAACGTDEKDEYAQQVEDVLTPLGENLQTLGTELSASAGPDELASGIEDAEDSISDGVGELEAITPPEGVEQVHEDLIAALTGFNDELAQVREAAESGDLDKLQRTAVALPEAAVRLEEELNDIQNAAIDAGVPIEEPGGE